MRRTPKVAAVLDQFVREVDIDEATGSWHPKAALIKLRAGDGTATWRLWIGSRNLTECVNRDIGLLLVSAAKRSEEHTSELQSLMRISYAVFCLKKKKDP